MAPGVAERGFLAIVSGVLPSRSARIRRILALGLAAAAVARASLWVSPSGDDSNPGTEERPLRTIERARDVVRTMNRDMSDDITVFIGGTHRLVRPIEFGPEDGASNGYSIIYTAAPGEHPVIGGGFRVSGWTLVDRSGALWQAPAPEGLIDARDLFINGSPASRTRGRLLQAFSRKADQAPSSGPDSRAQWRNPADVYFPPPDPAALWSERQGKPPFFVENAFELLGTPGQWYFDRAARKVYYAPRAGEDMGTADVEAAAVGALIVGAGSRSRPLLGLIFKGIRFAFTAADPRGEAAVSDTEGPPLRPAALRFSLAGSIQFLEDDFIDLGSGGLELGPGFREGVIEGCLFGGIAGSALRLENARQVRVANCRFSYVSVLENEGAAIDLDRSAAVTVEHVQIDHFPRFALLPQDALTGPNSGSRNRISAPAIDYDGRTPDADPREPEAPDAGLTPAFSALKERRICAVTAPRPPDHVAASPGDRVAYVTWDPPCLDGGSPVTAYLIASSHGAKMKVTAAEFDQLGYATFEDLENGHAVDFTVAAVNATGASPPSLATASIVPKRFHKLKPPPPPRSASVSTGFGEARFQITPPPSDGGSPVVAYSFTRVPSGVHVVFEGWDVVHADQAHPIVRTIKGFPLGSGMTVAIAALNAAGEGKPAILKLQR
jgi:hypothetical protein